MATKAGQLTINSGGQTWVATPKANVTNAQVTAATNAGWKPVSSGTSYRTSGPSVEGGQVLPPAPSTTIDASRVANSKSYDFQQPAYNPMTANAYVGAIDPIQFQAGIDAEIANKTEKVDSATKLYNSIVDGLDLPSEQRKLERQYQVPQITSQLQDANLQLTNLKNMYAQQYQIAENKAVPTPFIVGEQTQIQKDEAIKVGAQAAYVAALQGNLQLANQYVDRALDLEWKQYSAKLDVAKNNLAMIREDLTGAEKKKADELDRQYDMEKMEKQAFLSMKASLAEKALSLKLNPSEIMSAQDEASLTQAASKMNIGGTGSGEEPKIVKIGDGEFVWDGAKYVPASQFIDGGGSAQPMALAVAQQNIQNIDNLLSDTAIRTAVGANPLARFVGRGLDSFTGSRQNFIAGVEQMRSQLTLDNLINAKSRGATFGALSVPELQMLSAAASKLSTWAIKDKDGNVTGYRASEKDFKTEMNKINNLAKLDYILKGGDASSVGGIVNGESIYVKNSDGSVTQLR